MRRILLFILIIFSACTSRHIEKPSRILCFGDSITYGQGVDKNKSYPDVLAKIVHQDVINAGGSGDTTYNALDRLRKDVLMKKPDTVIIEFGGNDYMRGIPMDKTIRNMEEIIRRIQRIGARVFLCDVTSGFVLADYRVPYKDLALRTGAIFLPDIMEGVLCDTEKKSDLIHPNERGYSIIAQRIYRELSRYCKFEN